MNDEIAGVDTLTLPPLTRPILQLFLLLSSTFYHYFPAKEVFVWIFSCILCTLVHLPPLSFHKSEDAGIDPRTVANLALVVRRSKPPPRTPQLLMGRNETMREPHEQK